MKRKIVMSMLAMAMAVSLIVGGCGKGDGADGAGGNDVKSRNEDVKDDKGENEDVKTHKSLEGINVAWLGSDLVYGSGNDGKSVADIIAREYNQTITKEAVSGSSLVDTGENGYIARLKRMDLNKTYNMFIVEIPLIDTAAAIGEYNESDDREDYDTNTVIGAMQYIQSYVKDNFGIDASFMTSARVKNDGGSELAESVWKVTVPYNTNKMVIDLWHNIDLTSADKTMIDDKSNPTEAGYEKMFKQFMEGKMSDIMHAHEIAKINDNPEYDPANIAEMSDYPNLHGKKIIFLGSSVTFGSASREASFVEYMEARDGIVPVKEAVSGTTLVNEEGNDSSYIARMEANIPPQDADLFICQLSTNDASQDKPLGEVSESTDINDFDQTTIAGSIEYIIAYARQNYNCPVMFYTSPKYDSDKYAEMVDVLMQIEKKWQIGIIDMWNDLPVSDIGEDKYNYYMDDKIHPDRAGYLEWWTPFFEQEITEYMSQL